MFCLIWTLIYFDVLQSSSRIIIFYFLTILWAWRVDYRAQRSRLSRNTQVMFVSEDNSYKYWLSSLSVHIKTPHINTNYDLYQNSLGSTFSLVPLPNIILYPAFTQHEAPWHKLRLNNWTKLNLNSVTFTPWK